jgi:hypothetical protein
LASADNQNFRVYSVNFLCSLIFPANGAGHVPDGWRYLRELRSFETAGNALGRECVSYRVLREAPFSRHYLHYSSS